MNENRANALSWLSKAAKQGRMGRGMFLFVYFCLLRKERYLAGVELAKNGGRIESWREAQRRTLDRELESCNFNILYRTTKLRLDY